MKTNDAQISLPTSKSISNRWLMVNHVTQQSFVLKNLSPADDTQLLQSLLAQLRRGTSTHFYCHNAGAPARFMLALLAFTPGEWTLGGDDRLCQRPMMPLIDALRSMGCHIVCQGEEGLLPLSIKGRLPDRKMTSIDGEMSSQFVSALMLVGAMLPNGITISLVGRICSKPYIDMTRLILQQAGINVVVSANNHVLRIDPINKHAVRQHRVIEMERDWTSASYIYMAAALLPGVRIRMQGLGMESVQGDCVVAQIFAQLGVVTHEVRSPYRRNVHSVTITGGGEIAAELEYNFINCPDLLPAVLVACAALGVKTKLRGVRNLKYKESDRLKAIQCELAKMGGNVKYSDNEVMLTPSELHPTMPVCDYGDHRIAMAFAVLGLKYEDVTIENPDTVSKSFPGFWDQLKTIRIEASRQNPHLASDTQG